MSIGTLIGPRSYLMEDAICRMVLRYGRAQAEQAHAMERWLRNGDEAKHAEAMRWERAAHRRYAAIMRMTFALREVSL